MTPCQSLRRELADEDEARGGPGRIRRSDCDGHLGGHDHDRVEPSVEEPERIIVGWRRILKADAYELRRRWAAAASCTRPTEGCTHPRGASVPTKWPSKVGLTSHRTQGVQPI